MLSDDSLERRVEAHLKKLESKVELLEDLIRGDDERGIEGVVRDIRVLRQDIDELLDERRVLADMKSFMERAGIILNNYEKDKVLLKGIGIGLGFTSLASIGSLIIQITGG